MINEFDLRDAVRNLKDDFHHLDTIKGEKPTKPKPARKTVPYFQSMSPSMDGDWALNIEDCLLNERRDEKIPGGLLNMAHDALSYTDAGDRRIDPRTGAMVCAHLWRSAGEICWKFPAAGELLDLLREQSTYLRREFAKRQRQAGSVEEQARVESRQNSTVVCSIMAQRGYPTITPQHLHTWADRGHISQVKHGVRNTYLISEVLAYVARTEQESQHA